MAAEGVFNTAKGLLDSRYQGSHPASECVSTFSQVPESPLHPLTLYTYVLQGTVTCQAQ